MTNADYSTYDAVLAAAKSHASPRALSKAAPGVYGAARKNGWMPRLRAALGWSEAAADWSTYDAVLAAAKSHADARAFSKAAPGAYHAAQRSGWIARLRADLGWKKPDA